MNEPDFPTSATLAEQIFFLRAAAARCRRLASATGDVNLIPTPLTMAVEYDAKLQALMNSREATSDKPCG
ncbi:hypothetical protein ASE66_24065 [Bosea sp. Root483D1]|uniref:hypothetical protein n=1 Tax=Bosea sp. Root483D1 TaxID=1736544 RepID=UPI00070AE661|nr:hypothetical protein [Bosea sp. Root483D1]KRE11608.1 hypothetical protein ASE66_24065 [Bosea sp. Root483D1]